MMEQGTFLKVKVFPGATSQRNGRPNSNFLPNDPKKTRAHFLELPLATLT
jgi:hypothetical protein